MKYLGSISDPEDLTNKKYVDDKYDNLDRAKQDKVTGSPGQFVGFDRDGNIVAMSLPVYDGSVIG